MSKSLWTLVLPAHKCMNICIVYGFKILPLVIIEPLFKSFSYYCWVFSVACSIPQAQKTNPYPCNETMETSTNTPWWVRPSGDLQEEFLLRSAVAGWKLEVPCDFETVRSRQQGWSNFCYHPEWYWSCLSVFESSEILTCIMFAYWPHAFISENSALHDNVYIYSVCGERLD